MNKIWTYVWILTIVCLAILSPRVFASADNIRFERISLEGGLSQQTIISIFQDSRGYMWFGTQEGLNKYDGLNFTTYMPKYDDESSISSAWIYSISEDTKGNIWVGTKNGINVLDIKTNKFRRYQASTGTTSINDNNVFKIHKARNGVMWAATRKGLNRYNEKDDTFKHHNFISSTDDKEMDIVTIAEDITGALWLGSNNNGLMRFDPETEQLTLTTSQFANGENKVKIGIRYLFLNKDQVLWIATIKNGIYKLDLTMPKGSSILESIVKVEEFKQDGATVIAADSKNSIWVGTGSGLFYQKEGEQVFNSLNKNAAGVGDLSTSQVYSLYSDASEVFWVGTFNGLNKWNTRTTQFDYFYAEDVKGRALSSHTIATITSNNDHLIFITSISGVDILDTNSQLIESLPLATEDSPGLVHPRVMSAAYVSDEEIWFGYRAHGASRYNPKTNTYVHYKSDKEDPRSLPANGVPAIHYTENGELWFGSFGGGLARYNRETDDFTVFKHDPTDISTLSSDRILTILDSEDGNLWIGTWDAGLNVFVPSTGTAFRITRRKDDPKSLGSNVITSVIEDSENNIWVGTHSGGLNLLKSEYRNRGQIEFEKIDSEDGMPSNVVYGITEDEEGFMWASTNKGLVKLNKETKDITIYTSSQGTQGNEFHFGAAYKDAHGYMYFGGIGGLTRFNPKDIRPNPTPPKIVFTNFQRLNKFFDIAEAKNEHGAIDVYYTDYLIGFEFAALDFAEPKNNKYMYMMEGFDKDWVEVRDTRRATYTNLPSGSYKLRVIASNNDGTWNREGASIEVIVHPAPWFSWWAYVIYGLIASAIIWYAYVLSKRKAESRARYQKELQHEVQIRTAELSEANTQLRIASITDQLTGLHNRRYLSEVITQRVDDMNRRFAQVIIDNEMTAENGPRMMALMFDLDGFKPVNDNYGHEAGDQVIIQVANILKQECRKEDIVIRWGGDEYMVVAEVKDQEEAVALSERIRVAISSHAFDVGLPNKFYLSSSLGFALYPFSHYAPHSITWDQVHLLADQALYKSKDAGRNTWSGIVQVDKELPFSVLNTLVPNLDKALSKNEVKLLQRKK